MMFSPIHLLFYIGVDIKLFLYFIP